MIPDNQHFSTAGFKVIFVLQSADSILTEMNRYLAYVVGRQMTIRSLFRQRDTR
jgi:hypothetical protein